VGKRGSMPRCPKEIRMADRYTHAKLTALGNFPGLSLVANSADLVMTAANATNKEEFVMTGKDLLIAHNTGAGARTVTITSVSEGRTKRTGDITTYSIGAGKFAAFGPFEKAGWMQSNGKLYFEAEHSEVKFGVVTLP
jgi:hypothetical protein